MARFGRNAERPVAVADSAVGVAPIDGSERRHRWQTAYLRGLRITDFLVVTIAVAVAQLVRFGVEAFPSETLLTGHSYTLVSMALVALWLGALAVFRTRSLRVIGSSAEEYRRIFASTVRLFGLIAMISLLFRLDPARLYLAIAFPLGLAGLLVSRWYWRRVIARRRARGYCQTEVLVVGNLKPVRELAESFAKGTADGYRVVGVCIPGESGDRGDKITVAGRDIPVLGSERDVPEALAFCGADTVAVTATEQLGPEGMRDLVWELEKRNVDLVVAPGMVDVSGPRLSMRPVAGLPLIQVDKPRYHGAQSFAKASFDVAFSLLALVVISPVLIATAIAIKLSSRGPVFYKAERMGLNGKPFPMLKFRSMVQDADGQVQSLLDRNEGAGVLFKMRDDPRVTPVGRIIRRYSIDELPQFINVLRREMSVVGPRPPLRREVDAYDAPVRRRLLVKPGITGLWQVSGRSDLPWEETVRLDLSYVENWSMTGDLLIVAKTVKAVVGSDGAY